MSRRDIELGRSIWAVADVRDRPSWLAARVECALPVTLRPTVCASCCLSTCVVCQVALTCRSPKLCAPASPCSSSCSYGAGPSDSRRRSLRRSPLTHARAAGAAISALPFSLAVVHSIALPEEPLSLGVYVSLIPIITGVALSSFDEPSFDAQGTDRAPHCLHAHRHARAGTVPASARAADRVRCVPQAS